jgi:hypothetical protein
VLESVADGVAHAASASARTTIRRRCMRGDLS